MSDAAASDDSDLRTIVHCGTPLVATALAARRAQRRQRRGGAGGDRARLRGRRPHHRRDDRVPRARLSRLAGGDLLGDGRGGAPAAARRRADDARDRADRDLGRAGWRRRPIPASRANTTPAWRRWLGIQAARAAQRGYKCEERILEMKLGLFRGVRRRRRRGGGGVSRHAISARSWDIVTDMAVKLVPGGHPYHALAEAAANAAREGNIRGGGDREHHRVAARHDRAERTAAPERPDRHGAQPGLFHRRGRRRPRVLLGARRPRPRSPTRSSTR